MSGRQLVGAVLILLLHAWAAFAVWTVVKAKPARTNDDTGLNILRDPADQPTVARHAGLYADDVEAFIDQVHTDHDTYRSRQHLPGEHHYDREESR